MDIDTIRGVVTGLLLLLFIGMAAWVWSRNRKDVYEDAARMPLEDDRPAEDNDGEKTQ